MRKKYIQHPITLKLIPAEEYVAPDRPTSAFIIQDSLEGFMAEATQTPTYIDSKTKLRRYCKENGLTLSLDCAGLPFEKDAREYNVDKARKEIGQLLQRQLYRN